MSCGCNKNKINTPVTPSVAQTVEQVIQSLPENEQFIEVVYKGPEYSHYIGSPTGIIAKFGMRNYGLGKRGDKVKIHIEDYNKSSWLYEKIVIESFNNEVEFLEIETNVSTTEQIEIANQNALIVKHDFDILENLNQSNLTVVDAEPVAKDIDKNVSSLLTIETKKKNGRKKQVNR